MNLKGAVRVDLNGDLVIREVLDKETVKYRHTFEHVNHCVIDGVGLLCSCSVEEYHQRIIVRLCFRLRELFSDDLKDKFGCAKLVNVAAREQWAGVFWIGS